MFSKSKQVLKQFDLFGHLLTFEEDNSPIFKTSIGSFFSYLILIFILIAGFILGQEIYKRKTPSLVTGGEIVGRKDSTVYLKDFPFMMTIMDKYGTPIDIDYRSLLNVDFYKVNVDKNGILSNQMYYGFAECNVENYSEKYQSYMQSMLEQNTNNGWDSHCLIHKGEEEYAIANKYLTPDSDYLFVRVMDCNEETRNSYNYINKDSELLTNAPSCYENRLEILTYFNVKFNYLNSIYNFKDYDNPQIHFVDSFARRLGYGMMYSLVLEIGIERLISDNGWLLESKEETEIIFLDSISNLPFLMSEQNKELLTFSIVMNNQTKKNYRSYMKVQELFAKIGGLFSAFFLIIKLALYDYVRFKFKVNYSEYTIDATELEKHKSLYPEIDNYKRSFFNTIKNSDGKLKTYKNIDVLNKETININNNNINNNYNKNINNNNYNNNINNNNYNNNINLQRAIETITPNNVMNQEINTKNNSKKIDMNGFDIKDSITPFNITNQNVMSNNFLTNNLVEKSLKDRNIIIKDNNKDSDKILVEENINKDSNNNINYKNIDNKIDKTNTLPNFKFEEDLNSKSLNDYLIDKVNGTNYFQYILVLICGCCYKNKPVSYQIINSSYFSTKYSFKYFLNENKKFKCFERSISLKRS